MNINIKTITKCGKCGSKDVVNPYNDEDIEFKCMKCGHTRRYDHLLSNTIKSSWSSETDTTTISIYKRTTGGSPFIDRDHPLL